MVNTKLSLLRYCFFRELMVVPQQQYHQSVIDNARKAEQEQEGRPVAVALDTVSSMLLSFQLLLQN